MTTDCETFREFACALYSMSGLKIFPVDPHVKKPCIEGWKELATDDLGQLDAWGDQFPNARIGLYLKGSGLFALDEDGPNAAATVEEWQTQHSPLPKTWESLTRRGKHRVFRYDGPRRLVGNPVPELDVKHDGFIILPPSAYDGGNYTWVAGCGQGEIDPADAPLWLLEKLYKADSLPPVSNVGPHDPADTEVGRLFSAAGLLGAFDGAKGVRYVRCPNAKEHTTEDNGSATVIWPANSERKRGWFECMHAHCAELRGLGVLDWFPKKERKRVDLEMKVEAAKGTPAADVMAGLVRTSSNQILAASCNISHILLTDERWAGCFRYDSFSAKEEFIKQSPIHTSWDGTPVPLTDFEIDLARTWLTRNYEYTNFKENEVGRGLATAFKTHSVNPLRELIDSYEWDGKRRVERLFIDAADAPDDAYSAFVARMFLLPPMARLYDPGCKVDTCVILEGPQGIGKSTIIQVIAGSKYFTDTPIEIGEKAGFEKLQGVWFVEVSELGSWSKRDVNHLKSFMSSQKDKYRVPWDRRPVDHPRSCVFVGTTNQHTYLQDATGARRFIPIWINNINLDYVIEYREQLLAEAREMYKGGMQWHPNKEEDALAALQQEQRYQEDPIEIEVKKFFADPNHKRDGARATDIAKKAFSMTHVGRHEVLSVTSCCVRLKCGWKWLDGHKLYSPSFPQRK